MVKPKVLSGRDVVGVLARFDFAVTRQRGSHAKLKRINSRGETETLTVPLHDELDRGTLHALFRQASRYVPQETLRDYFYSE